MDWTPNGTETVSELRAKLAEAGFKVAKLDSVERAARDTMGDMTEPDDSTVPGIYGSQEVAGFINGVAMLRSRGFNFLADKVAQTAMILVQNLDWTGAPNKNTAASTTGGMGAAFGAPQWFTLNMYADMGKDNLAPDTIETAPWGFAETLTGKASDQDAFNVVAVHEFGHLLDNLSALTMENTLHALAERAAKTKGLTGRAYGRAMGAWFGKHVSGYARASIAEATAETFSRMVYRRPLPAELDAWAEQAADAARNGQAANAFHVSD